MKRKRIIAFLLSAVMVTSMGLPAAAEESGTETLQNQVLNLKFEDNLMTVAAKVTMEPFQQVMQNMWRVSVGRH